MEAEEITKLVDGVYKNILDKFNPGARQLIAAGKSYLKALHGAATASRLFNEALAKIALNAQQSGTADIGSALMSVVNVNKEIQEQQMNILKAFYVDLLVPLETNLEKDTKVVQHEQKKFLQQHKVRMESYQKAVSTMKKQRKKKATPENTEKELRSLQVLEDQKKKLDAFCEQSYKNAMTQERRRYGFVLERQSSIAKHWMVYHTTGKTVIDNNLENWQEIAASREIIPAAAYENSFNSNSNGNGNNTSGNIRRLERIKDIDDDTIGAGIGGGASHLKKSRSIDAPYGDMRTLHERESSSSRAASAHYTQNSLPRAKSDFNLATNSSAPNAVLTSVNDHTDHHHHQQHQSLHHGSQWDQRPVAKALYAYMPSGENQLPFDEGDRIALVGGKAKGWQFGENLRTQLFGWFPIAYTNAENNGELGSLQSAKHERYENMHYERNGGMRSYHDAYISETQLESDSTYRRRNHSAEESSPTRMFGDTISFKHQKKYRPGANANPRPGPPPTLPAPVPNAAANVTGQQSSTNSARMLNTSQSFCAPNGVPAAVERRKQKLLSGQQSSMGHLNISGQSTKPAAAAKTSLHSSNDSGFANEPPPQPEVDYSDEEPAGRVPIRRRADTNTHSSVPRDVASWTLNRNFRNSVDSQIDDKSLHRLSRQSGKMRYDLIASDDEILQASSTGLKRTKSFWKFGGGRSGEDILAGMSLWQHRDLVAAPNLDEMRDEDQLRRPHSRQLVEHERNASDDFDREDHHLVEVMDKNGTLTKSHNSNSSHEKRHRKDSITSTEIYGGDEDENIYGVAPLREPQQQQQLQQQQQHHRSTVLHANYTPKSRMKIMKTIEIDIENPTENERISTIKRGQKAYNQEDYGLDMRRMASNGRELEAKSNRNSMLQPQSQQQQRKQQQHSSMPQLKSQTQQFTRTKSSQDFPNSTDEGESDEHGTLKMSDVHNFFDDLANDSKHGGGGGGGMIMKTVKRKDILKQYYTSEDDESDAELKSTSSDPYDCIVINDHLVRKDEKLRSHLQQNNSYSHQEQQQQHLEFQTFRASTNNSNNINNNSNTGTGTAKKTNKMNGNSSNTLTRNSTGATSQQQHHQQQQQQQQQHQQQSSNSSMAPTATILPRTRLLKSSSSTNNNNNNNNNNNIHSSLTLERNSNNNSNKIHENGMRNHSATTTHPSEKEQHQQQQQQQLQQQQQQSRHYAKSYGPWYDFWDQQVVDHNNGGQQQKSTMAKLK